MTKLILTIFAVLFLFTTMANGSSGHSTTHASVDPNTALRYLKNGNKRFLEPKSLRKDGQSAADLERLSKGQHPHTIVLSCADSRVPPELIFDQKLGEIFVVRAAGQALDSSVIASVEYAAEHLGSTLIVVMGHTECGAVKAAMTTKAGTSAGSEHLDKLVADIQPRIKSDRAPASGPSEHLITESGANAKGVARQLGERSKIIRHLLDSGKIKVVPSLYHLDNGQVHFME